MCYKPGMAVPKNKPIHPPLSDQENDLRELLRGHVEALAGLIGIRHDSRPSSLDATVAYIEHQFASMGQTARVEAYPTDAWDAKNLVVEWPGSKHSEDVVILGGHYDTVRSTPGADDNATAIAGLLAVCRLLKGRAFSKTIRFVAFANEEPPHFGTKTMGSMVYAKGCKTRGDRIHAMVCLEMLGYYDTGPNTQEYPAELPKIVSPLLRSTGDFIALVSDFASWRQLRRFTRGFKSVAKCPVTSAPLPGAQNLLWVSDHGPFWDQGYPALMVTDTAWFRNPHYHAPTDTPETLDYDRMARVVGGVAGGVAKLAGG